MSALSNRRLSRAKSGTYSRTNAGFQVKWITRSSSRYKIGAWCKCRLARLRAWYAAAAQQAPVSPRQDRRGAVNQNASPTQFSSAPHIKKSRSAHPLINLTVIHRKRFYASNTSICRFPFQSPNCRSSANSERWHVIQERRREATLRWRDDFKAPKTGGYRGRRSPVACRVSRRPVQGLRKFFLKNGPKVLFSTPGATWGAHPTQPARVSVPDLKG